MVRETYMLVFASSSSLGVQLLPPSLLVCTVMWLRLISELGCVNTSIVLRSREDQQTSKQDMQTTERDRERERERQRDRDRDRRDGTCA